MSQVDVSLTREQISTLNCDQEPVHIPGNVQGFAVLFATDAKLRTITYCSENVVEAVGTTKSGVLGKPLSDLFESSILHDLNNTLSLSSARSQRERVGVHTNDSRTYEIWAHVNKDGVPIIELERVVGDDAGYSSSILAVRSLLTRLQSIEDLHKTLHDAVVGLRALTRFSRVMAYKFDTNGDGEIVAEDRSAHMEPFLGLRFPKWDIPTQARDILKRLPLRMIDNVGAEPVSLVSLDPNAPPLDLSIAACRGTSQVHCEYLRNMGVASTMTLSIVVNDTL